MKSQTILVILAAIAVVFGVTFASQYLAKTKKPTAVISPDQKALYFPIESSRHWLHPPSEQKKDDQSILGAEMEIKVPGAYDFWFQNTQDVPIEVGLKSKTCKCTMVNVRLAGNDIQEWNEELTKTVLASCFPANGMINSGGAVLSSMEVDKTLASAPQKEWSQLEVNTEPFIVPPHTIGQVRMNWDAKEPAVQNLKAEITMKPKEGSASTLFLSVPIVFVEPFHIQAGDVGVGTILVGGAPVEKRVVCWSSTRSYFSLIPAPSNDPFVICGDPVPLSDGERWKMEEAQQTRVASAYWVPVTIREQAEVEENTNGIMQKKLVQMDLGPFRKPVGLIADNMPKQVYATIQGEIKDPDISVEQNGREVNHDKINFGSFPANTGAKLSAAIAAPARFNLQIDKDKIPGYLKARLELDEGESTPSRKSWKLKLETIPGAISGVFPDAANSEFSDAAITIKLQGTMSRGIRIPVQGNATFR
jgi:hypothetical protein